jgi:hypothetical protein
MFRSEQTIEVYRHGVIDIIVDTVQQEILHTLPVKNSLLDSNRNTQSIKRSIDMIPRQRQAVSWQGHYPYNFDFHRFPRAVLKDYVTNLSCRIVWSDTNFHHTDD